MCKPDIESPLTAFRLHLSRDRPLWAVGLKTNQAVSILCAIVLKRHLSTCCACVCAFNLDASIVSARTSWLNRVEVLRVRDSSGEVRFCWRRLLSGLFIVASLLLVIDHKLVCADRSEVIVLHHVYLLIPLRLCLLSDLVLSHVKVMVELMLKQLHVLLMLLLICLGGHVRVELRLVLIYYLVKALSQIN